MSEPDPVPDREAIPEQASPSDIMPKVWGSTAPPPPEPLVAVPRRTAPGPAAIGSAPAGRHGAPGVLDDGRPPRSHRTALRDPGGSQEWFRTRLGGRCDPDRRGG